MKPKISCICPTRGRFGVLRESISFFLLQDYPNKELIIFNNHPEPIIPHPKLIKHNIKVINAGDYSGKSMELVYAHAMKYISDDADYVAVWDDDDMYFPWHLSDNISKLIDSGKSAIRAKYGYWQDVNNSMKDEFVIIRNTLEASMIAKRNSIFFNEVDKDKNSAEFTHPHTSWVVKVTNENGYTYNSRITANFRWNYGKKYSHLQSVGPHTNNDDTGKGGLLKPTEVSSLFYNFLSKVHLITDEKDGVISINNKNKVELYEKISEADIHKFDHVDKYKVWLYWNSNSVPTFLNLCFSSIIENTFADCVLLNDENIKQYNIPDVFWSLNPVERSEYIRVYFLHKYGGWWFDADTYVVGDLDEHYFKYLNNHETVFPWEYNVKGNMTTPIFSSKPNGLIINDAIKRVDEYFTKNKVRGWAGANLEGIMKSVQVFKNAGEGYFFGLMDVAKYGYNNHCIAEWNFFDISPSKLQMIIFHWSQIGAEVSWKIKNNGEISKDDIINQYPNLKTLFDLTNRPYQ